MELIEKITVLAAIAGFFPIQSFAFQVGTDDESGNYTSIVEYVLLDDQNPCARKCLKDELPMTCRYHFQLEWYNTLSKACFDCPFVQEDCFRPDCIPGDGHKRPVSVVNRRMPGPSIEVCLGDEVIIDVENQLGSESTTIHWHGHHQKYSPYMDGVPMVTQCPISPGSTFRYQFKVTNPGTHFWHSHSGFQRADGAFGAFIVRVPEDMDPHDSLYDYDMSKHVITVLDWGEQIGLDKFVAHHHSNGDNKPSNILVNGLGKFKVFDAEDNTTIYTPVSQFNVQQGYRYRFRLINGGFLNCPIEVSVDNHTLKVISTDGNDIEAVDAESIVIYAGERFDFIITADQPKDSYWMRFSGLMDCDERFKKAHQVAVLTYDGSNSFSMVDLLNSPELDYEHSKKSGKQINSLNKGTEGDERRHVSLPKLKALDGWDDSLKKEADFKYYVSYDFYRIDNPHFHKWPLYGFHNVTDKKKQLLTPQLNHISMKLLPFPLLSQRHQIQETMLCNETTVGECYDKFCECTHVVNLPLHSVVELILIDQGFAFDANHPFHLHGHSFRVVAMERMGKNVTVAQVVQKDRSGGIKRNLESAPFKDTVTVPDGGYTVVRFKASNPGYWLFHCHIEFHVEVGMALVFKVGRDEDMPAVPKDFPKCGDYLPEPQVVSERDKNGTAACKHDWLFGNNLVDKLLPEEIERCQENNGAPGKNVMSLCLLFLSVLFVLGSY